MIYSIILTISNNAIHFYILKISIVEPIYRTFSSVVRNADGSACGRNPQNISDPRTDC